MARRACLIAAILFLSALAPLSPAFAYWPTDGRPVGTSGSGQLNPAMTGDGGGGAILFWADNRNSAYRLTMHHVLSTGAVDPAVVTPGLQYSKIKTSGVNLVAVPDGSGGAIAVWQEQDSASARLQVRALRVGATGVIAPGWPDTSVAVSRAAVGSGAGSPAAVSDGAGGVIVAWQQANSDTFGSYDLWVSHIASNGTVASGWTAGGMTVCALPQNQYTPRMDTDGSGGAVVAWLDQRNAPFGTSTPISLYAQRVTSAGSLSWTADGVALYNGANNVSDVAVLGDGAGGAVISYSVSSGGATDVFAQRLNSSGAKQWGASGTTVCNAASDQSGAQLCSDGGTGTILAWYDSRNAGDMDIYAQRLNSSGAAQWTANGVVVCNTALPQEYPRVVTDGAGGAIITWVDFRNSTWDMFGQRLGSAGAPQWTANGLALCLSHNVDFTSAMVSVADGSGGVLVAWDDHRVTSGIYLAKFNQAGITGPSPVTMGSVQAVAANGAVELEWWAHVEGTPRLRVFRAPAAAGPFEELEALVIPGAGPDAYHAVDRTARPGREYYYQVGWREYGAWTFSRTARVATPAAAFGIRAVTPNPFRAAVRIEYELAGAAPARVEICDVAGRCLVVLNPVVSSEGTHAATWNGRLESGRPAASGIYFARLVSAGRTTTRRMVLLK
ncbi:MAG: T9SS type A sorting domain-containing protein [Candidatus Eisenbacteria bacterium]|nr:T9SS type A sorting domain-containing protein [Candidatus Eisenbacteria bacterium]